MNPNNFLVAPLQYDREVDQDFQDQHSCVEGDFQEKPTYSIKHLIKDKDIIFTQNYSR